MYVYSCLTANIRSIFPCSNGIYSSKRIILIVCMYMCTFIGKEINVPFQCKGIRQLITYVRTIHHIKKLTLYAHCISTGTGGVRAMDGRGTGTDTGLASAILSDRRRSEKIQNVSRFWK